MINNGTELLHKSKRLSESAGAEYIKSATAAAVAGSAFFITGKTYNSEMTAQHGQDSSIGLLEIIPELLSDPQSYGKTILSFVSATGLAYLSARFGRNSYLYAFEAGKVHQQYEQGLPPPPAPIEFLE